MVWFGEPAVVPWTPGSPLGTVPGVGWLPGTPVCAKDNDVRLPKVNRAIVNSKNRNFIPKPRFSARAGLYFDYTPGHTIRIVESPKKFDAESGQKVIRRRLLPRGRRDYLPAEVTTATRESAHP